MLHSERKRQALLAERELAGESLWSPDVPEPAREKLVFLLEAFMKEFYDSAPDWYQVHRHVAVSRGVRSLTGISHEPSDLRAAVRSSDNDMIADVLEAVVERLEQRPGDDAAEFTEASNAILASYRVSMEIVAGRIVEFESRELHQEVVVPAVLLFGGDPKFASAERAYQDALREVATDAGAADAITDAGTCLQEVLAALGCTGNALGPLLKDARKKGLLAASDNKFSEAISNLIDWVSSDRSATGDAHNSRPATREDAWLAIHVVGALALRLAAGKPRAAA